MAILISNRINFIRSITKNREILCYDKRFSYQGMYANSFQIHKVETSRNKGRSGQIHNHNWILGDEKIKMFIFILNSDVTVLI